MKNFASTAALLATLAAVTTFSVASAATTPVNNTLAVQVVTDSTQHSYGRSRAVFSELRGRYEMDDGTTLWLYQNGTKFIAEVTGSAPVEVRVAANNRLVAINGGVELAFKQNSYGSYGDVVLTKALRAG